MIWLPISALPSLEHQAGFNLRQFTSQASQASQALGRRDLPAPSPTDKHLEGTFVALGLPVPSSIDKDLKESLVALGTPKARLTNSSQERPDWEREDARRTPPAQGRPGPGAAGTTPAPCVSPARCRRNRLGATRFPAHAGAECNW